MRPVHTSSTRREDGGRAPTERWKNQGWDWDFIGGGPAGPGDGVGQCLAALRLCVNTSAPPRWENAPELLRRDGHKHNSIAFHQVLNES
ncbi:unnamed protein product [Arctogadus glacialis]